MSTSIPRTRHNNIDAATLNSKKRIICLGQHPAEVCHAITQITAGENLWVTEWRNNNHSSQRMYGSMLAQSLKEKSTVYEQRDISVPRKQHAETRNRDNWSTDKTRKIHRVVYSFNHVNPYNADIVLYKPRRPKGFVQFEITIKVVGILMKQRELTMLNGFMDIINI